MPLVPIGFSLPTTTLLSSIAFAHSEGFSLCELRSALETERRLSDNNFNASEGMYTDLDEAELKINPSLRPPYDNVVMEHN